MADFGSLLKGVVSNLGASGSNGSSSSEGGLDLAKVKSILETITGSKGLLESTLGADGTNIVTAADGVRTSIDENKSLDVIKKGLSILKAALSKVQDNKLCATVVKSLEAMGV